MVTPGISIGILKREEQAGARALVRLHVEDVHAVHQDFAGGDSVVGMPAEHLGQRALAGAVRPHDGVDFAALDLKAQAADNFDARHADVQIFDD